MTINIALQGLSVAQRGFEVASNNIANVNTPGYSRQQIDLSSRAAPEQGVQILSINRVVDLFSQQQHWSSSAAFQSSDAFAFYAGQLDNLLANSNTSLSASLDQFFSALQTGVDDPSSIPNRELILAQADATAERFVEVDRTTSSGDRRRLFCPRRYNTVQADRRHPGIRLLLSSACCSSLAGMPQRLQLSLRGESWP